MENNEHAMHMEALLFALGRPVSRAELQKYLGLTAEEVSAVIAACQLAFTGRGLALADDGREVELRVAGGAAALIEKIRKEEYSRDIGKAGQETLAAVLYRGPLTRAEVDFIRGVNSTQTLRTLTMRGFLRRIPNPRDERSYLYEPTTELFAMLGITHASELPDYTETKNKLTKLEEAYRANDPHEN